MIPPAVSADVSTSSSDIAADPLWQILSV